MATRVLCMLWQACFLSVRVSSLSYLIGQTAGRHALSVFHLLSLSSKPSSRSSPSCLGAVFGGVRVLQQSFGSVKICFGDAVSMRATMPAHAGHKHARVLNMLNAWH